MSRDTSPLCAISRRMGSRDYVRKYKMEVLQKRNKKWKPSRNPAGLWRGQRSTQRDGPGRGRGGGKSEYAGGCGGDRPLQRHAAHCELQFSAVKIMGACNQHRGRRWWEPSWCVSFVIFQGYQIFPRQITACFGAGDALYFDFAARYFRIFSCSSF